MPKMNANAIMELEMSIDNMDGKIMMTAMAIRITGGDETKSNNGDNHTGFSVGETP